MKEKELNLKHERLITRLKRNIADKELYNTRSIIFKITFTAMLLGLATAASLIEPRVYMPWGTKFPFRIMDTVFLVYGIAIVGILFILLGAIAQPWIHFLLDSDHSPIEMVFWMISNVLVLVLIWFVYYILFNASYKSKIEENVADHDIHEYHIVKKPHDHHHKYVNLEIRKKIIALTILSILCALIETIAAVLIARILLSLNWEPPHNHFEEIGDSGHVHHGAESYGDIFSSWHNLLIFSSIFYALFLAKYILASIIFVLLEHKTRSLIDKFGIYV